MPGIGPASSAPTSCAIGFAKKQAKAIPVTDRAEPTSFVRLSVGISGAFLNRSLIFLSSEGIGLKFFCLAPYCRILLPLFRRNNIKTVFIERESSTLAATSIIAEAARLVIDTFLAFISHNNFIGSLMATIEPEVASATTFAASSFISSSSELSAKSAFCRFLGPSRIFAQSPVKTVSYFSVSSKLLKLFRSKLSDIKVKVFDLAKFI
mmetsp:Transcript_2906/g.4027  ORF Transcript_2906/g.4027 Transcript_2906/m.4027 type:complete len:208 (+) Transcript_2906:379-1002(+)